MRPFTEEEKQRIADELLGTPGGSNMQNLMDEFGVDDLQIRIAAEQAADGVGECEDCNWYSHLHEMEDMICAECRD